MSDTIHLECKDCQQALWIGQGGYSTPTKAYLYSDDAARAKFTRFYDDHRSHDVRLVHMEQMSDEVDDERYDD